MVRAASTVSEPDPEPTVDFDDIVLLPMPKRTYKLLADAAYRKGQPLSVFVQGLFDHFVSEALKK